MSQFDVDIISTTANMKTTQLLLVILSLLCLGQARPPSTFAGQSSLSSESFIVGGSGVNPAQFPWQLSIRQVSANVSVHNSGGVILTFRYGLTVASSVSGISIPTLKVVAGLHDQTDMRGTQTVSIHSCTIHPQFGFGMYTNANDIAVLRFATILLFGVNIQAALLPYDNSNNYNGQTCEITGWGRTSSSDVLPNVLQKASIDAVSTDTCQANMFQGSNNTVFISDSHICVYDSSETVGACDYDEGSPMHCQDGGTFVVGLYSWNVQDDELGCLQSAPSVYTRVSSYLPWIRANTPALKEDD